MCELIELKYDNEVQCGKCLVTHTLVTCMYSNTGPYVYTVYSKGHSRFGCSALTNE